MATPMLIVLAILAGAIALWSWGRPRADIVGILVVVALLLSGVLTPQESFAGFGDPVVILIAAVFIVGAALENTGIVHRLSLALLSLGGGNEARLLVLVMLIVGALTAFMSSTAVTAMFIPVVLAISERTQLNRKRMLMPLTVAATVGGMMTLISSLPNMIVVNVLESKGLPPLGFFSVTPFGLSVLVAAIAFMLLARGLLSREQTVGAGNAKAPRATDLVDAYGLSSSWHRLRVPAGSPLAGRSGLRSRYGVGLLALGHRGERLTTKVADHRFDFGDTLLVSGGGDAIARFRQDRDNFVVRTLSAEYEQRLPARHRAPMAIAIVLLMIVAMASGLVHIAAAAVLAALAMLATRCVPVDFVYRAIGWKTIALVASMVPLATALNKTGVTTMIAHGLVSALGSAGPTAMLVVLFLVTSVVGLFLSNAATTMLIAPVAIEAAQTLHVSPEAFAMTRVISCSASFVTPVSSTWNLLVMEPGDYSFGDYVQVGVPLVLLTMLITVTLVRLIYRF